MKRKLFTLLVAFAALATFQTKAQNIAGGTYWIDTRTPIEKNAPDVVLPNGTNSPFELATGTPYTVSNLTSSFSLVGQNILNVKGKIHSDYALGDYSSYFTISRVGVTMTFRIASHSGKQLTFPYGGQSYSNFEFVQFHGSAFDSPNPFYAEQGTAAYPADVNPDVSIPLGFPGKEPGGFLCLPMTSSPNGGTDGRVFVVVNSKTGGLEVKTTSEINQSIVDYNDINKPAVDFYYSRIWARAYKVGGRWATIDDFKNSHFVKFTGANGVSLFANDNYNTRLKYDVFRVNSVGFIPGMGSNWDDNSSASSSHNALTWVKNGLAGTWSNVTGAPNTEGLQNISPDPTDPSKGRQVLPLFSIRTADDSCKYLSVKKANPIYSTEQAVNTAYSDQLEIRNYGEYLAQPSNNPAQWGYVKTTLSSDGDVSTSTDEIKRAVLSQVFAIWIDADGELSIYPAGAYVYDPSSPPANRVAAGFEVNRALLQNTPVVAYDGGPAGLSFKIGQRQDGQTDGGFCLTPVRNFQPTYHERKFSVTDWTDYASIEEGRYFFLETKPIPFAGGSAFSNINYLHGQRAHVLSVQPVYNGDALFKKVVMIPKEELLSPLSGALSDYSQYPLDSVIMSAHWEVKKVYDATTREELGYRLVNELGDTLQYNPDYDNNYFGSVNTDPLNYSQDYLAALAGGATGFSENNFPEWVYGNPYVGSSGASPAALNSLVSSPYDGLKNGSYPTTSTDYAWTPELNLQQSSIADDPANGGLDVWRTIKRKDDPNGYVNLRLNYYGPALSATDWAFHQVNLDTIADFNVSFTTYQIYNTGWYNRASSAIGNDNNKTSSRVGKIEYAQPTFYYQRDVVANVRDIHEYPELFSERYPNGVSPFLETSPFGNSCTHGIELKFTPVTYSSAGTLYDDASDVDYYKQDSLTAYLYKQGVYNITEAVDLQLNIGLDVTGTGTGIITNVASMVTPQQSANDITIEPVGEERNRISGFSTSTSIKTGGFDQDSLNADALYGDPYKWHYIRKGNLYLTFDTINTSPATEDLRYGFRFKDVDKLNATPVRFYQPLVGDKINENFIIQFIVPTYYYEINRTTGVINYAQSYSLNYGTLPATDSHIVPTQVRFIKFNKQSGPLYITKDVRSTATRFHFTKQGDVGCRQEFVETNYLLDNGLYRLPFTAEAYERGFATDWYITANATEQELKDNATELKITLADTLHAFNANATMPAAGIGPYRWAPTTSLEPSAQSLRYYGYDPATAVFGQVYQTTRNDIHLFYIQNAAGDYLTVIDETAATQSLNNTTNPDVYGTKLAFRPKYTYTNENYANGVRDLRPLQMFAIHGCTTTASPYGEFVLLPVASYVMDYQTKRPVAIDNNINLGRDYSSSGSSNVSNAFRISRYGRGDVSSLIVVPGNSAVSTSVTAEEFKFTPEATYAGPFCYHNFVREEVPSTHATGTYAGYYGADTKDYERADKTKPILHWSIVPATDRGGVKNGVYTFNNELKTWRGNSVENETLKGEYYIVTKNAGNYSTTAEDKEDSHGAFEIFTREQPKEITNIVIACIDDKDHDVVCDNAPQSGCYDNYYRFCDQTVTSTKFGIIEAVFNDRYIIIDNPTGGQGDAITIPPAGENSIDFLRIVKSWVRPIAEHHSIPYYHIVATVGNQDYYLEVEFDPNTKQPTDVQFRVVPPTDLVKLLDVENYPTFLPGTKFCFPYRLDADGNRIHPDNYPDKELYQVFAQTLDTGVVSSTMLKASVLKIMYDSRTIDAVQLPEEDILLVNYADVDKLYATTWFFGDNSGAAYEWVDLSGVKNEGDDKNTTGWLTSAANSAGNLYATASGASPVNYGILEVYNRWSGPDLRLTFEFVGDTLLGSYTSRPIWYYRIKDAYGQYLTNAVGYTDATYKWSEGKPYAFFSSVRLPDKPGNPIKADANYDQTFGLRHVPVEFQPGEKEHEYFWVVSRVDYANAANSEYYYLSQINDRLVFSKADLNNIEEVNKTAMVFQLGQIGDDDVYTDTDNLSDGTANVYGVEGAVKVTNATGLIELYAIDGRKINAVQAAGSEQVIAAPRGVVIVKVDGKVTKVVVK